MSDTLRLFVMPAISLAVAFALSFAATPLVKIFARRVGAIDVPKDARRMHTVPIPRLGGLAIFLGFLVGVLFLSEITPQVRGMLLGSVIIVVLGVIDDIHPLRALLKLAVQVAAALVAVYSGLVVRVFSNPNFLSADPYLELGALAVPLTVLWIVAITNSVNLIDGLDGLAVGVSAIGSFTLLAIALVMGDGQTAVIVAALTGACIGFMPYNLNPAKIFMGDTGATFLGFILATVSIAGLFKFYAIISFAVPFLVLGLPLFDTSFAFFRRLMKGKNPMAPDRSHVHHRLIDMGLNQKQAVAILYVVSAILGLSAVVLATSGAVRAMIFFGAVCIAGVIGAEVFFRSHAAPPSEAPPKGVPDSVLLADGVGPIDEPEPEEGALPGAPDGAEPETNPQDAARTETDAADETESMAENGDGDGTGGGDGTGDGADALEIDGEAAPGMPPPWETREDANPF